MRSRLHSALAWFGLVGEPVPPLPRQHDRVERWGKEILVAIDDLEDLINQSPNVPLTETVRIDAQLVREAAGRVRPAATDLFGMVPGRTGPTADIFSAVDELEGSVAAARRVPLTKQLQIDKHRVFDVLRRLREMLADALAESHGSNPPTRTRVTVILAAIDAIDDLAYQSRKAIFSDVVMLDETALRDASARLRSAVGDLTEPAGDDERPIADMLALIDDVDELAHAAKRARSTGRLRVSLGSLYELLDRLRVALGQIGSRP
jgi:hypothetical protein